MWPKNVALTCKGKYLIFFFKNIYTCVDVANLMLSSNSSEVEMALCNHKDTQYYLVCFGKQKNKKNIKYNI